jgi:hypothetical protein
VNDWELAHDDQAAVADALATAVRRLDGAEAEPGDALGFLAALGQVRRLPPTPSLRALLDDAEARLAARPDLADGGLGAAEPAEALAHLLDRLNDLDADPLEILSATLDLDALACAASAAGRPEAFAAELADAAETVRLMPDRVAPLSAMAMRHMARHGVDPRSPVHALWAAIADAAAFEAALELQPSAEVPERLWEIVRREQAERGNVVLLRWPVAPPRASAEDDDAPVYARANTQLDTGERRRPSLARAADGAWELVVEQLVDRPEIALYVVEGAAPRFAVSQGGRALPLASSGRGRQAASVDVPGTVTVTLGDRTLTYDLRGLS